MVRGLRVSKARLFEKSGDALLGMYMGSVHTLISKYNMSVFSSLIAIAHKRPCRL